MSLRRSRRPALETAGRHGLAERPAPPGEGAVGLADGITGAFPVLYDTRSFQLGRGVDDTPDGPFGREHRADRAVRVHALHTVAVVRAAGGSTTRGSFWVAITAVVSCSKGSISGPHAAYELAFRPSRT